MFKKISLQGLSTGLALSLFISPVMAQQLSESQIPSPSVLSRPTMIKYEARVNNAIGLNSFLFRGRRFASYQFKGEENQLIRITLIGGMASDRDPQSDQDGSTTGQSCSYLTRWRR